MTYNYWTGEFITLEEGEYLCESCAGAGISDFKTLLTENKSICHTCVGHGKLDWIDRIVGKKYLAVGAIEY